MNIEEFKQKCRELDSEQKYDEILTLCDNQLAEINSESKDNKEFLAVIYCAKGRGYVIKEEYPTAIEYFNKSIIINPDYAQAYLNRGWARYNLGQYTRTIEDSNKAIEINPDFANAYYIRGIARINLGQYTEAIEDCNKAIAINPDFAEVYYCRGNTKSALGQYAEAMEDYNKSIELNPEFADTYCNRGNTKRCLGQYTEAIEDYNKAIKLNPDFATAYYNRGNAKNDLGQYAEAIEDYNKAIKLNPDYPGAYYNRGYAKNGLGQYAEAIEDFNKAIELEPDNIDRYFYRALLKLISYEITGAIEDFNIVIEKSENSELIELAKENLDRLEPLITIRPNAKEYTEQKISSLPFNVSKADREFISSLADNICLKSMYIALAEYSTNKQNYKFLTELILDEIFLYFINLKEANFPQENYNRILSEALWSTAHVAAGDLIENPNFDEIKNRAHEAGLSSFLSEARTLLEENLITQENYDKLLEIPELKEYQAKYDKEMLESLEELQKKVHNPFVIVGDLIMYGIVYPILRVLKNISKKLNKKG